MTFTIDIRPGTVDDLRIYGQELLDEHYREVCVDQEHLTLNPDWERYEAMIEAGQMFLLCAWTNKRELVGYSANIVMPHLHYRMSVWCWNDVLFVTRGLRQGGLGLGLIRATETEAKKRGAHVMAWHAKPATALEAVLERVDYRVQETIYSRNL